MQKVSNRKHLPHAGREVEDGELTIDPALCSNCGLCVNRCPFDVVEGGVSGYKIYIGGRWGKKMAVAQPLNRLSQTKRSRFAL